MRLLNPLNSIYLNNLKIGEEKTIFVNSHGNKLINNENIILRILRTLFSNIFYLFAFDSKFILVNSYKLKLKNILNNSKPDCIILSGPPFSLFKLALFIKSYDKKIKVIIDYRDGWTQRIKSSKLYII